MTFIATRRRFGRYVYAYGGNPDAADLAGINTRWTIMKTLILMGVLCAIAAAIASARLNGATLDVGQSYELYVIAAAVVGGTSFAGGIGTIPGRGPRRVRHAVARLRPELHRRQLAWPEHRGRHRPDRRRRLRHVQPPPRSQLSGGGTTMTVAERTPLVEMRDINVAFGGVHAVRDVTIDLYAGEVVGLVGGNGAGKSTLMRVLSGAHPADSGEILVDGKTVSITQPARRQGLQHRDDLPDAGPRRQHRCAGQRVPRPRDDDAAGARSTTGPWRTRPAR